MSVAIGPQVFGFALVAGYSETPDYCLAKFKELIGKERDAVEGLNRQYKRHKRRSHPQRQIKKAWDRYIAAVYALVDFHETLPTRAFEASQTGGFDNYFNLFINMTATDWYFAKGTVDDSLNLFNEKIVRVSSDSGGLSLSITTATVSACLMLAVAVVVLWMRHAQQSNAQLAAQDRLLHQQAHEMCVTP